MHKIDLIVYDFDGVMTDNKVFIDQNGRESVAVNRSDGLAISEIKKKVIEQIILSSEKNPVVRQRAKKLELFCLNGTSKKKVDLEKYLKKNNIDRKNVVFIGNEINDLEVMKIVGLPVVPNDAHPDVKKIARIVTDTCGGQGVIREFLDIILDKQNKNAIKDPGDQQNVKRIE